MSAGNSPDRSAQEFTIGRVLDAPRKLVFDAWSKPEHLARWWGPKGCAIKIEKLEFRAGGMFHYSMTLPHGVVMWGRMVYREITAPERIVFVNSFSDAEAGITANPWNPDWPLEVLNTITFTEEGGKTVVALRGVPINATDTQWKTFADNHPSMSGGFNGSFDVLAAYLATL
ncbi:MAG TPA: SRPBCC domain-containing protein [Magnetospirillaceae bacterium]|jgi:uncharacterized protein YndB with AHSA1/START domain